MVDHRPAIPEGGGRRPSRLDAPEEPHPAPFLRAHLLCLLLVGCSAGASSIVASSAPKAADGKGPDRDGDGIPDPDDKCPDVPEDFDFFEDEDGCPDADNDQDGVLDKDDACPNAPGRRQGMSEEGRERPGSRRHPGDVDMCPDAPEDKDGFDDQDGCPDPDNDKDGILDVDDKCPDEPGPKSHGSCPKKRARPFGHAGWSAPVRRTGCGACASRGRALRA